MALILPLIALLLMMFGWIAHFYWKDHNDGKEHIALPLFIVSIIISVTGIMGNLLQ